MCLVEKHSPLAEARRILTGSPPRANEADPGRDRQRPQNLWESLRLVPALRFQATAGQKACMTTWVGAVLGEVVWGERREEGREQRVVRHNRCATAPPTGHLNGPA